MPGLSPYSLCFCLQHIQNGRCDSFNYFLYLSVLHVFEHNHSSNNGGDGILLVSKKENELATFTNAHLLAVNAGECFVAHKHTLASPSL